MLCIEEYVLVSSFIEKLIAARSHSASGDSFAAGDQERQVLILDQLVSSPVFVDRTLELPIDTASSFSHLDQNLCSHFDFSNESEKDSSCDVRVVPEALISTPVLGNLEDGMPVESEVTSSFHALVGACNELSLCYEKLKNIQSKKKVRKMQAGIERSQNVVSQCTLKYITESVVDFARQNLAEVSRLAGGEQSVMWKRHQTEVSVALAKLKVPLSKNLPQVQGLMQGAMDNLIQSMAGSGIFMADDRQMQTNSQERGELEFRELNECAKVCEIDESFLSGLGLDMSNTQQQQLHSGHPG